MKKLLVFVWAGLALCGSTVLAVPQLIDYQGQLTDSTGAALDTTVSMTFTINYAPTGGVPLWTETQPAVVVSNGSFTVQLGSVSPPLPDVFGTTTWLGLAIGGDAEMTPRQPINSVPYAYRVGTVDGSSGGDIGGDVHIIGKGNVGSNNTNAGQGAFVAGQSSHADGTYSSVSGGALNWALGAYSHVGGGQQNRAGDAGGANYQTVAGGVQNFASAWAATVSGGQTDTASGQYSVVSGGAGNLAAGPYSAIGGGGHNLALGSYAVVAGGGGAALGDSNAASGTQSCVGGGVRNRATETVTTVAGGYGNTASAVYGAVGGGFNNSASGLYSTVPGGGSNAASGMYSCALGLTALASHEGSFVWGSTNAFPNGSTASFAPNSFTVRCGGGARFYTTQTGTAIGAELPANQSAWVTVSDSTKKERYGRVNTQEVLNKITQVPIETWSYKQDPDHITHMGPMAQDFYAAYRLGESDTTISTLDPDGVALAAIQELAKRTQRIDELEKQVTELRGMLQAVIADQKQTMQIRYTPTKDNQ